MFLLEIVHGITWLHLFLTFLFIHISSVLSEVSEWLARLKMHQYIYYEVHNLYKENKGKAITGEKCHTFKIPAKA